MQIDFQGDEIRTIQFGEQKYHVLCCYDTDPMIYFLAIKKQFPEQGRSYYKLFAAYSLPIGTVKARETAEEYFNKWLRGTL